MGTMRAVTDIYGAVVARYAYEPFGSLTTASGLVDGELHRFTGKPSDLETSLSYFNARYYDPTLGRFTSSDPAKDGLNWYQYCNGNPIVNIDQDGEAVTNVVGLVVGAGGGALLGNMLSDHYGLTGLKRAATIAGCSVGGAVIGWFAGPVVDKIANEIAVRLSIILAPSGLMMDQINNSI